MPRPKGSKNKKATAPAIVTSSVEEIEQKMAAVEAEITSLSEQLKNRKDELKALAKEKEAAIAAAAAKKAEEDKQAILDAVEKSGKSIEEILELLK